MKYPKLIGITGQKGNGKDTIANYLCSKYGYSAMACADILKKICSLIFDLNDEQLNGNLKEVSDERWFGLTPRKILQFVGTDLFRNNMEKLDENFGKDIWILTLEKRIMNALNNDKIIVISDIRFQNELDLIKKFNGTIIRVKREGLKSDNHESEINISNFIVDHDVKNNGSFDDLYSEIDSLFV